MKNVILFILIFPLCFYQCERKKDETYYLSENEKQFFPYKNGDRIKMYCEEDSTLFIASGDSTSILSDHSGLYGFSYEQKTISLNSNETSIYIRINKFRDPFCVYLALGLGKGILFELEPFVVSSNSNGYITFIGDTTIYSLAYSDVYLLKSGGNSVGGVGLDSLYYSPQYGLISLRSNDKEYRFIY